MSKLLLIAVFLALLAVGLALGVARDLYSSQRRVLSGEIVEIRPVRQDFKSALVKPPVVEVKLDDGSLVDVTAASTAGLSVGDRISLAEMVMPWGQLWYRLMK